MARPRKVQDYTGTALGALVGGLLGGPAGSAIVGAGLGALVGSAGNRTRPLPLDAALSQFLAERNLQFGGMERRAWNVTRVVFGRGPDFFFVDAGVTGDRGRYATMDELDDALYDSAARCIVETMELYGLG